jgi:hypothetical protein
MRGRGFLAGMVLELVRALAYGWALALLELARGLWEKLRSKCARKRLPHPDRHATETCAAIVHPAFRRPDPCIYSQAYLASLGLPVTWDNPDIVLRLNGVVVPEHDLQPATEYEIEATIYNNSYTAPALGLTIEFSYLTFGIGAAAHPIGATAVSVGVKGGPGHPARTAIKWTTPPAPGHYCIQAKIVTVEDANPQNNLGQNNVDVADAHSPAAFTFRLRNGAGRERGFRFTTDTYKLLDPPDCGAKTFPREPRSARIKRVVARHKAQDFSVPAGWTVAITPDAVALAADAEIDIAVAITPPAGFVGEKTFNVKAFADAAFAGGVTLTVKAV